ncbi:hypothetical protein [Clostridium sp.]|nr:hypothetical protein [Clostridium sp.]
MIEFSLLELFLLEFELSPKLVFEFEDSTKEFLAFLIFSKAVFTSF